MKRNLSIIYLFIGFLFLSNSYAETPKDAEYLDGGASKSALILAHGRGKHPTWLVVEPLRNGVHEKLGYHTLSLQMPNDDDRHWKEYAEDFPTAYRIIDDAIRFLKQEKNIKKIYLMGHSMGSRMVSAYMAKNNNANINGLIIAGCRNNGGEPFDCHENVSGLKLPILDIWGNGNYKDQTAAQDRSELKSKTYTQVAIDSAEHKFVGYDDEFVSAVVDWLKKVDSFQN